MEGFDVTPRMPSSFALQEIAPDVVQPDRLAVLSMKFLQVHAGLLVDGE